ncbi:MAG: hypothetical protein IPP82_13215 [Xanthomonadales bacterium]|nr:hypothetical protein [Xanthomonadales bacterium]
MSKSRSSLLMALILVTACSKPADSDSPLAFVPADTAFVMANTEPSPEAAVQTWTRMMQGAWPNLLGMYDSMLDRLPDQDNAKTAQAKRVIKAILAELRERDTPDKWAEIGFSTKARAAFYGVGLVPVLRIELGDADKFRAMVARVEENAGAKLAATRIGDQDIWTVDMDKAEVLIAIEGRHLVVSALPDKADASLRRRVLGLDRPNESLESTGGLTSFNKAEGYLPYGSGWIDFKRIVGLIDNDPGYAAFASLATDTPAKLDAVCRSEFDGLAAHTPRMVMGYTRFDGQHFTANGRLDLDSELASSVMKLSSPPPGSAASSTVLYDIALSLPILKIKDFLVERSNAIVNSPYRCGALASLNEAAASAKQQLTQVVPPPLSDFTGLRVMINRLDIPESGSPDASAAVLIGSSNPMGMIGMAQMALPGLRDFKLALDGKAVDLPAGIVPTEVGHAPSMQIAANDTAMAVSMGGGIDLSAFLSAPTAADGQLMHAAFTGAFYDLLGTMLTRFSAMMPDQQKADVEAQTALYKLYARWIQSIDMRINATPKGIEMIEDVNLSP